LVSDIDEAYAIRIIDRFLMYYIYTADKLNRTATWLEKMPGGIECLREVVINDKLGLCEELERRMQHLVDTYQCEWNEVVKDPKKRKRYRQFVNTDETVPDIELIDERGQSRPVDWPRDDRPPGEISLAVTEVFNIQTMRPSHTAHDSTDNTQLAKGKPRPADTGRLRKQWVRVGQVSGFSRNGGAAIKFGQVQIAVYNFTSRGEWYVCQNMCPHKNAFVLSRGIVGSEDGEPKLTCPLHKTAFSLKSGKSILGDEFCVKVFPVKCAKLTIGVEFCGAVGGEGGRLQLRFINFLLGIVVNKGCRFPRKRCWYCCRVGCWSMVPFYYRRRLLSAKAISVNACLRPPAIPGRFVLGS
jgi:NAD(P)H-dependent nitrite reductase small subunit